MKDTIEDILERAVSAAGDIQPWRDYYKLRAKEMGVLLYLYGAKRVGRVLEIGCGNGFVSGILSEMADEVVATDLSKYDMKTHSIGISKAEDFFKRMNISNCRAVSCSGEELPFADNTFDLVFCMYTLEHLADRDKAMREIKRVLRDGSRAVVLVPCFMERILYPFSHYWEILTKAAGLALNKIGAAPRDVKKTGQDNRDDKANNPASPWRKFRSLYPRFPSPEPHGEYPNFLSELAESTSCAWIRLMKKSGLRIKDRFTIMLFPKSFFSIFLGGMALDCYIKTLWIDKKLGKNRLLRHLGQNLCMVLEKRS